MTEYDFEASARCVKLYERLRQAVRTRQYTDRPGDGWRLTDFADLPTYVGTRNKVMISATEDGEKFEVLVYNFQGRQLHSKAYKTMDVAFRNGVKFADIEYPKPAEKVVEEAPAEVAEDAPVVDEVPAVRRGHGGNRVSSHQVSEGRPAPFGGEAEALCGGIIAELTGTSDDGLALCEKCEEIAAPVVDEAPAAAPKCGVIAEFSQNRGSMAERKDSLTLTAPLEDSDPFERVNAPHAADWAADNMLHAKGWQVVGEWEYVAGPNVYRAAVERVDETVTGCVHGNTPHADVTGDPIEACRTARGVEDFGVFNDEGCIYVYGCAVDVANEAVKESAESDYITWSKLCAEHEEQPAGTCGECHADADADDET